MNDVELADYRVSRLKAAIDRVSNGDRTAFGRRLGYKDGAFVRQMLAGKRPISEKTIRAIEALPGLKGWFDPDQYPEQEQVPAPDAKAIGDDAAAHWERYCASDEATRVTVDYLIGGRKKRPAWMSPALAATLANALALVAEQFPSPRSPRHRSTGTHG